MICLFFLKPEVASATGLFDALLGGHCPVVSTLLLLLCLKEMGKCKQSILPQDANSPELQFITLNPRRKLHRLSVCSSLQCCY